MTLVLASIVRFCCVIIIGVIKIYMCEFFPSVYRAIGVTLCCILGRIGSALAPICINYL